MTWREGLPPPELEALFQRADQDAVDLWKRVVRRLDDTVNPASMDIWIAPLRPVAIIDGALKVAASDLSGDWVARRYREKMTYAAGIPVDVCAASWAQRHLSQKPAPVRSVRRKRS